MDGGALNPGRQASARSVVVVDDEPASAELTAALLRSQGYEVRVLSDGEQALEAVSRGEVDLLVLDLMMARLDGVDVCAYIRNQLHLPFLPVIITTSLHDRESRIRAKDAGADDLLVKPVDGLELLVRIESLLRARASLDGLEHDRERLLAELHAARMQLHAHERTVRAVSLVGEELRALAERQRRELEILRKRCAQVPEAREPVHRLTEMAAELEGAVESLDGTRTVARVQEGDLASAGLDPRPAVARVTK